MWSTQWSILTVVTIMLDDYFKTNQGVKDLPRPGIEPQSRSPQLEALTNRPRRPHFSCCVSKLSGFSYLEFLIWCLVDHLCVLNFRILIYCSRQFGVCKNLCLDSLIIKIKKIFKDSDVIFLYGQGLSNFSSFQGLPSKCHQHAWI